jgi:hypothetical protein
MSRKIPAKTKNNPSSITGTAMLVSGTKLKEKKNEDQIACGTRFGSSCL